MRHYELVVVLSPMLNQEQLTETWSKIKGFITTRNAEISHEEQWGTRRLAYPIRKGQHRFLEGSYHLTRFATERAFNIELENFLKVDDEILRSLVTTTLPEEELAAQAAAAARAIRTPPPRPAPVGPDGQPLPAEGAAPAVDSPTESPVPETLAAEEASAADEPVIDSSEEALEAVAEPELAAEELEVSEPAAAGNGSSEEAPHEPVSADEASPEESEE
ncbi:MAG: 30S ribosomal protein S6 [Chloroflexota bacterium]|nr:30S ribosomal protein S6 [Chloroflexota bacterium]PKB62538.1 MAG: 30S ribosomal protein S6 [SAR202 cluster bacterium Ae2-Chloro-G3]